MKKVLFIFWAVCLVGFGVTPEAWSEPILVGWDYGANGGLVQFDIETGAYTTIMNAPALQIEALAYDTYNGILYGVVNGETSLLVKIDWKQGLIFNIGIVTGFNEITSMTFDDTTATIFALDQTTRTLLSIDPITASPTVIGHYSYGSSNALAANPITGELFMSLMGLFGSIDKTTGQFTLIGDTGLGVITGLDFLPKTQLLYGFGRGDPPQLFTLDLETAVPSFIGGPVLTGNINSIEFIEPFLEVAIDIKPGSDPNSINPKSKGKIPVAILSTKDFNALMQVDQKSLTFGSTGDEASLAFCNPNGEDINGDGLEDLLCHFYTQDTGFKCGNTEGILKGQTVQGTPIKGGDSVKIGPCK
jgi:hypothetical protein